MQKVAILIFREALRSEWQIDTYENDTKIATSYNCSTCLKQQTILAYQNQNATIKWITTADG